MAKKKPISKATAKVAAKAPAAPRASRKLNEAKETKNFMVALFVGTLLLIIFLYFILVR
jgi:uncharacterized integral membrane protein